MMSNKNLTKLSSINGYKQKRFLEIYNEFYGDIRVDGLKFNKGDN